MRSWLLALIMVAAFAGGVFAQEDKKTDDLKPADPDIGRDRDLVPARNPRPPE
jgi:porin